MYDARAERGLARECNSAVVARAYRSDLRFSLHLFVFVFKFICSSK